MKKTHLTALLLSAIAAPAVLAQTAPAPAPAPTPEHTLSVNAGVVTDYRYRGISQSRMSPAFQFGGDYSHKSGAYVGVWGSTINWIKDQNYAFKGKGIKGGLELDLYGGYKATFGDLGLDVGFLRYQYQGNDLAKTGAFKNPNTNEIYVAGTYGPATLKYSHAVSNLFGTYDFTAGANKNSKGSGYLDATANFDVGGGVTLTPHLGYQRVANFSSASYADYSLGVSKDFDGLTVSATAIGTNAKKGAYVSPKNNKELGKPTLVLGAKYTYGF